MRKKQMHYKEKYKAYSIWLKNFIQNIKYYKYAMPSSDSRRNTFACNSQTSVEFPLRLDYRQMLCLICHNPEHFITALY